MTAALTPELALEYLAQLSTDIRASVVLEAEGERLAGDPALAEAARGLLAAARADQAEVQTSRGAVYAARSSSFAVAVVTGRFALPALVRYDVGRVLIDLEPAAAA